VHRPSFGYKTISNDTRIAGIPKPEHQVSITLHPWLMRSILGVIGLSYGTLWFFFVDRGSLPLTVESITVMGKIEPNQGDVQYSYIHLENQKA
jgi:hypothetical protein